MSRYVDPTKQLVTEIMVSDIRRSTEFYRRLGFALQREAGGFVELTWEEHQLFLDERPVSPEGTRAALSAPSQAPPANIRVMVPNVDAYWRLAQDIGHASLCLLPIGRTVYVISPLLIPMVSASASPVSWRQGGPQPRD